MLNNSNSFKELQLKTLSTVLDGYLSCFYDKTDDEKGLLNKILSERSERVQQIFYLRYFGSSIRKHADIARELGLSRERVKQCIENAHKHISHPYNMKKLYPHLKRYMDKVLINFEVVEKGE